LDVRYHEGMLEDSGWSGWSRSDRRASTRSNEEQISIGKRTCGGAKKKAPGEAYPRLHRGKRTESATHRCRTWALADRPHLQSIQWKTLSVAAGSRCGISTFALCRCIKKEQVVDFLAAWCALGQPLLIGWDRLPGHRSRLVQTTLLVCRADFHCLSSTLAPELNPVEYIWVYWSSTSYQCLPKDYWQLSEAARRTLRRIAPSATDHRLLEAIFFMARIALYYARFSKFVPRIVPIQIHLKRRSHEQTCVRCVSGGVVDEVIVPPQTMELG